MRVSAIVLLASLCWTAVAADTEIETETETEEEPINIDSNRKGVMGPVFEGWYTMAINDVFYDRPIMVHAWFEDEWVVAETNSRTSQDVALVCNPDVEVLYLMTPSNVTDKNESDPFIKVLLRIDDQDVLKFRGAAISLGVANADDDFDKSDDGQPNTHIRKHILRWQDKPKGAILLTDSDLAGVLPNLQKGNELKIRTTHGSETRTFVVSLEGFNDALGWVRESCTAKEHE